MEISKEEFERYRDVQRSGVTNMFDIKVVSELTGLNKKQILYIMEHYDELEEKYSR